MLPFSITAMNKHVGVDTLDLRHNISMFFSVKSGVAELMVCIIFPHSHNPAHHPLVADWPRVSLARWIWQQYHSFWLTSTHPLVQRRTRALSAIYQCNWINDIIIWDIEFSHEQIRNWTASKERICCGKENFDRSLAIQLCLGCLAWETFFITWNISIFCHCASSTDQNDERRSYVIRELIETEESYVKNLNVLSDVSHYFANSNNPSHGSLFKNKQPPKNCAILWFCATGFRKTS